MCVCVVLNGQVLSSKESDVGRGGQVETPSGVFATSDLHKYSPQDFNFVKILGKGSFGKVNATRQLCCRR